jgi:peroxiredoxin
LILLPFIGTALFGQSPTPLKAGDHAPPIIWTRILQPLTNEAPPPFLGRTTVIGFFPNVSSNASSVSRWNKLIAQFAGKSVNFVCITSESEPALASWLLEHPMNGWLLLDPTGETTRAYGAELSGTVIIDSSGRIAGFTFMDPDHAQIQAVLDGRALAIDGDATDAQLDEILAGRAVRLDSVAQSPTGRRYET